MATRRCRRTRGCRNGLKCQGEQGVARKNGDCFAKFLVTRGFAPPQIVIIQRRQVIVNQRIRMDEFDGAAGKVARDQHPVKDARRFQAQNRPDPLAAGKNGISHGLMNRGRWNAFARASTVPDARPRAMRSSSKKSGSFIGEACGLVESGERASRLLSPSASNGSATIFPSAFFKRFPLVLRLLPVASGILSKGQRLPQTVSSLRPARVAGFLACARPLPAAPKTSRNRASWEVPVFSVLVDSRYPPGFLPLFRTSIRMHANSIAGNANSSKLNGHSV